MGTVATSTHVCEGDFAFGDGAQFRTHNKSSPAVARR
jgi:hypothetical protein